MGGLKKQADRVGDAGSGGRADLVVIPDAVHQATGQVEGDGDFFIASLPIPVGSFTASQVCFHAILFAICSAFVGRPRFLMGSGAGRESIHISSFAAMM